LKNKKTENLPTGFDKASDQSRRPDADDCGPKLFTKDILKSDLC
jgi:hypothetical protein